jgi:hypothetical protein
MFELYLLHVKCDIEATRFGRVVRGLSIIHEVLDSILIDNFVNKKKCDIENFSSHPQCFFYTPNIFFCPWINISECVFRIFSKFELEKLRKTCSEVFI